MADDVDPHIGERPKVAVALGDVQAELLICGCISGHLVNLVTSASRRKFTITSRPLFLRLKDRSERRVLTKGMSYPDHDVLPFSRVR